METTQTEIKVAGGHLTPVKGTVAETGFAYTVFEAFTDAGTYLGRYASRRDAEYDIKSAASEVA